MNVNENSAEMTTHKDTLQVYPYVGMRRCAVPSGIWTAFPFLGQHWDQGRLREAHRSLGLFRGAGRAFLTEAQSSYVFAGCMIRWHGWPYQGISCASPSVLKSFFLTSDR